MRIKIATLALLAIVLYGCGTSRHAIRGEGDKRTKTTQERKKRVLYPTNYEGSRDNYVRTEATTTISTTKSFPMTFSYSESENVRVPGINPLPAGGIKVSLDELKREFCYPLKGKFLSDYGMRGNSMHTGVDIKAALNDTIRAAFAGVVRMSKLYSSYGNVVVIRHYNGFETLYSHNSKNLVEVNDVVEAGSPIALAGRTGRATTEHLHFELRAAGEHLDPKKLIDVESMTLRSGELTIEQRGGQVVAYNTLTELKTIEESERLTSTHTPKKEPEIAPQKESQLQGTRVDPNTSAPAEPAKEYHTVKSGDTLYAIAIRNKTTVKKLCDLNGIKEGAILKLNQKIRVK